MKKGHLLIFSTALLFVISCKKGDIGPAGPAGATGATGATGPAGPPPYASNWIKVDSSMWHYVSANDSTTTASSYVHFGTTVLSKDTSIFFHATIPFPKLTQKIIDSGFVYFYFKDSANPKVPIFEWFIGSQTSVGVTNQASIKSPYYIFAGLSLTPGSISLSTLWQGQAAITNSASDTYDPRQPNYYQTPPKTKFFIRMIAVQGSINGGRMKAINFKDYSSVQKAFKLKD